MRFLHTSDWHLGRIFHGVHLVEDQAYVLEQLVQLVKTENLSAVVIAGDIYDRAVPPVEAVELLDEVLSKLIMDCKIPVIVISGNHDSPERVGFASKLLEQRRLFVRGQLTGHTNPIILHDDDGPVYFFPFTYAEPALVREKYATDEAKDHDRAMQIVVGQALQMLPDNIRKVAVAHAFITGGEVSESERPLSVGGSGTVSSNIFKSFNYTALGHLHNSQRAGSDFIRYSGSLLKYSFSEANHTKGVNIVDINKCGECKIQTVNLTPRRDVRCISGYFKDLLNQPMSENKEDYLLVTLRDIEPVLDPMGQLRRIYPNVMQIEKPQFAMTKELTGLSADYRSITENQLFASFFEQVTGQVLTLEQQSLFNTVLDELYSNKRRA